MGTGPVTSGEGKPVAPPGLPRPFEVLVQLAIVVAIVSMCLETMPSLLQFQRVFFVIEAVTVAVFTVEYVARWMRSGDRLWFALRVGNVIDALAILPFFLALGVDLRGLRVFRLLRLGRIFAARRYSQSLQTIQTAIRDVAPELGTFAVLCLGLILVSAMALYYAEHDAQPEAYSSIPATLWWAVVTLTTVGYGDAYPVTLLGRVLAAVIMLTGIGLVAIPTSLLSGAMTDAIRDRRVRSGGRGP